MPGGGGTPGGGGGGGVEKGVGGRRRGRHDEMMDQWRGLGWGGHKMGKKRKGVSIICRFM